MRFLLLICLALASPAWTEPRQQILFEPKAVFPAQGGPAVKAAYFPAGAATLVGGRGELVLRGALGLGVGTYSLSTELLADQFGVKRDIGLNYGGLVLNYSFFSRRLLYYNISVLVGPCQAYSVARLEGAKRRYAEFAIFEPEISAMVNVTKELRVGVGASYRFTNEYDTDDLIGSRISGGALSLTLMYGKI